jgi:hypothetical protein
LLNKNSFSKFHDFTEITKDIDEDQKILRWAESAAIAGADNYMFVCVHLSSNKAKNKTQILALQAYLIQLKD